MKWGDKNVKEFGKKMSPPAYQTLPTGPIDINSPQGMRMRVQSVVDGMFRRAPNEVYKGWQNYYNQGTEHKIQMRSPLVIIFIFFTFIAKGQSLIGRYDTENKSHNNNNKHYEQIILNADSTFRYLTKMEFIKINKEGKWTVAGDTIILNEINPCCKQKIIVQEQYNKRLPKGKVRFYVTTLEGEDVNYHLAITNKDSTQILWSKSGLTELKIKRLIKFYFIVNSLVYSPIYDVKSVNSNEFKVKLATSRFFYNEKWLIKNETIVPMGWNNQYSDYYLKRQM